MKLNPFVGNRVIKNEEAMSRHINILMHYDDVTLLDKSGKLIQIIKLSGIDFLTQSEGLLDLFKRRRNHVLKNMSSDFAFYTWDVKRKVSHFPSGIFKEGYANEVNQAYCDHLKQSSLHVTELYLAVITKHPEGLLNKPIVFLKSLFQTFDSAAKKEYLRKCQAELKVVINHLLSSFSEYRPQLLSAQKKNDESYSESLAFISQLINYDAFSVPLAICDASKILPRKRIFFNGKSGTIELRGADESKKFTAILSIKAYAAKTRQGIFDTLINLPCEYTLTQSFRFYDRPTAKSKLRDQQKEMLQTAEESITLTEQLDEAYDDAASGEVGFGKHHLTLACYADSVAELNNNISKIIATFADMDIACVREDIACELGFWAQLPGNFAYIARPADISTKNMAAFASFHNLPVGKLLGNHWGDAVTVFETLSGTPYYFNFHYKDVGNFLVFGAMGSGKTVLIGFLILQSMKFGGKRIVFDKDRGLEILVRAMGGIYERIKPNIRTGFNPSHLQDNKENRHFLALLLRRILSIHGEKLTEADLNTIDHAINGLYQMDMADRQFCHLACYFGANKGGSLRARFDQWHSDGPFAWVFDNEHDSLNLDADVLGFDLSHILSDEICKIPALMYLTYRCEKALEGHRGLLFCDEGSLFLNDDYFKTLINDWSRTPRKKDNIFGLATQIANDTTDANIGKALNESAFCKIFFPNPLAQKDTYVYGFGLSDDEYESVKNLSDELHCFLLVYGRGINKQSVPLRLNLKGLEDIIAVISARESTLQLMNQIIKKVGNSPNSWLPLFLKGYKELK